VFSFAPRIYGWLLKSYINKLYRRLRIVETELDAELTTAQIEILKDDLEHINRGSRVVPIRHSDLFFALRLHIKQARADLNRRLTELR
jgi:hypothetical protein